MPTPLVPQVFVIAGIGALAGVGYSVVHPPLSLRPPDPLPTVLPTAPATNTPTTNTPASSPTATDPAATTPAPSVTPVAPVALGLEITLAQAKALFDAGAPFLDARPRHEYDAGHVAGAFYLTADMLTRSTPPEVLNFLDPASPLVIYCGGGACDASHNVAALLQQLGFQRYHIMKDGMPAWAAAGFPTSTEDPLGANGR
jgi:rhodanese-related sulfurtransferase